jgi:hypothetical protein
MIMDDLLASVGGLATPLLGILADSHGIVADSHGIVVAMAALVPVAAAALAFSLRLASPRPGSRPVS